MDDNMALKAFRKWFSSADERSQVGPLYAAIIAEARLPHWYVEGGVADSIDGRFDMVNAVLALVLIRLEALGDEARVPSTLLAETFVNDMDGQLRELGIGDVVVGKHIGRMMGALGGRLGAYRLGFGFDYVLIPYCKFMACSFSSFASIIFYTVKTFFFCIFNYGCLVVQ